MIRAVIESAKPWQLVRFNLLEVSDRLWDLKPRRPLLYPSPSQLRVHSPGDSRQSLKSLHAKALESKP